MATVPRSGHDYIIYIIIFPIYVFITIYIHSTPLPRFSYSRLNTSEIKILSSIADMSDFVDFVSPNAPDLHSKEHVKMLCTKYGRRDNHFIHTHNGEKLFIKCEVPRCEWKNQQFLLDRFGPRAAIRIPKIYAVFGEHITYI